MLGAYVAFQIFAAPVEQRGPGQPAPQPIAQANVDAKTVDAKTPANTAETTGSAPAKDDVAAADRCRGQTWPNLTRDCMEQMRSRKPTRTVTTDHGERAASDAQPSAQSNSAAAPAPAANASNTAAAIAPPIAAAPAPQPADNQVATTPPSTEPAATPANRPDVASAKPAKSEKHKVKEARRKKPKSEEGDDHAFAYAPYGDRDDAWGDRRSLRPENRSDRSRRERVIVRGEDNGGDRMSERGDRRVIVIRRDRDSGFGGGGIFGNLFGN